MRNWIKHHRLPCLVVCLVLGILVTDYLFPPLAPPPIKNKQGVWDLEIREPVQFIRDGIRVRAAHEDEFISLRVYETVPLLYKGDRVRVWGQLKALPGWRNPGAYDSIRQAQREGVSAQVQVKQATDITWLRHAGVSPLRFIESWRYHLREQFQAAPWLRALVLGDRSALPESTQESLRRSGLAHLLAISGQHVGMIALLSFALFRLFVSLAPRLALYAPLQVWAWLLAWVPTSLYVVLAGAPISAVRAWLFLTVFVLATGLRRQRNWPATFAIAAALILLWDPSSLYSISFQLSFMAVAALVFFCRQSSETFLQRTWRLLRGSLLITVLTAPLIAYYFHHVPMWGAVANLIAIPWFTVAILPLCLLNVMAAVLFPASLAFLMEALAGSAYLLTYFAELLALWAPPLALQLSASQVWMIYAALGCALLWRCAWWQRGLVGLAAFTVMMGCTWAYQEWQAQGELRLTVLDVGQGDAMLLRLPDQSTYLIDGGGFYIPPDRRRFASVDIGERVLLPYLKAQRLIQLDGIILSHPHPDHYEGLLSVIAQFPVQHFYWSGDSFPDSSFDRLMATLRERKVAMHRIDADSAALQRGAVRLTWLGPSSKAGDLNNRSIVLRVDHGETCFLLTGDIERAAERSLIGDALKCDVLKVPHHGSRTSSHPAFLDAVQPELAVISAGRRNPFGHPAPQVLKRYESRNIPVYRTDLHGAITLISDGKRIEVETVARSPSLGSPRK